MRQYEMFELEFVSVEPEDSAVDIDLKAEFLLKIDGRVLEKQIVTGFYAGNNCYKIRFLPQHCGNYEWRVFGIINEEGSQNCIPADTHQHGIVCAKNNSFFHADGSRYVPFGTTIYALSHQEDSIVRKTMETLSSAPFNKVRHCIFPKHYNYNYNEPELFPFDKDNTGNWDVHRPCFSFWDRLESHIISLGQMGIQSDLILFHPYDRWGFSKLSRNDSLVYLSYAIRRLAAIPNIWWSLANEYDLIFDKHMEDWFCFETFISQNDPYRHLISNHNCFAFYDFHRENVTHCSMQTTQVEHASEWIQLYQKPIIYDECCYEGDFPNPWGNSSAFEMVNRFWIVMMQGGYVTHGETYLSDDDVVWWAKGGELKGASPRRIQFLKEFVLSLPSAISPWIVNQLDDIPKEFLPAIESGEFFNAMNRQTPQQHESMLVKEGSFCGRCNEDVFMQYLARHCNRTLTWHLPEEALYRIEVVDVWDMTRKTILRNVNGKIEIPLPGKEGVAVIAHKQ